MSQSSALIHTLKQQLKLQGVTYAMIAQALSMSEANIKRLFASERFTVIRLEQICQLINLELTDLARLYEDSRQHITQLSIDQEKELIADTKLMLVAVCVRNHLNFNEIISNYQVSEPECIKYLAKLDRLNIIDLLPGNKIKLRIAEDFHWQPYGPIERFYEKEIQGQFLKSGFNQSPDLRLFLSGLLSEHSQQIINKKLQSLAHEFTQLHRQDCELPLQQRRSIGLLLATREWEFSAFTPYLRKQENIT